MIENGALEYVRLTAVNVLKPSLCTPRADSQSAGLQLPAGLVRILEAERAFQKAPAASDHHSSFSSTSDCLGTGPGQDMTVNAACRIEGSLNSQCCSLPLSLSLTP